MKRRGFLQALLAAPAVPYVPAIEARPFVDVAKVRAALVESVDFYPSNYGEVTRHEWDRGAVRWDDDLGWVATGRTN